MDYENALNFLLYSYFGIDGGVSQLNEEKNHKSIVFLCPPYQRPEADGVCGEG